VGGTTPFGGVTIHKTRRLTLNEVIAAGGPLEILQNNTLYDGTKPLKYKLLPNRTDFTPVAGLTGWNTSYYTELPYEGETELWEIVNLTADAHPIHPHLVDFQVLNRQALDVKLYTTAYDLAYGQPGGLPLDGYGPPLNYNSSNVAGCSPTPPARYSGTADLYAGTNPLCVLGGNPDPANILGWQVPAPVLPTTALVGLPLAPNPQEIGWKDTVQAYAGMVTRVLVRFARVTEPANADPTQIGYEFDPNHGHGYVWHCHIVDHEDNEMMRPFSVTPNAIPRSFTQGPGPGQY
jgi:FtsP/CotA-like multicopper oxidase with cupredoxin domain